MPSRFDFNDAGVLVDTATGAPPTQADHDASDKTHAALMLAESAFQTALVAKYKSRAGDMRYRTNALPPAIKALGLAYQVAVDAWRATWVKEAK